MNVMADKKLYICDKTCISGIESWQLCLTRLAVHVEQNIVQHCSNIVQNIALFVKQLGSKQTIRQQTKLQVSRAPNES